MEIVNELVFRVIPIEKASHIRIGDKLPIPIERNSFDANQRKSETEDLFDSIRLNCFPHLPSRKSVLFVLPHDIHLVEDWVVLHNPHNDYDYALCTLKVTGVLTWCDEDIFTRAGILPGMRKLLAKEYWESASDTYEEFETPEGLFSGDAIVASIDIRHHACKNRT